MKVLVTGANGFVGQAVCRRLLAQGAAVAAAIRRPSPLPPGVEARLIGDIGPATAWDAALAGIDAVVHLAARVHVMDDRAESPLAAFRHVNTSGTLRLAAEAARLGVPRLIFMSSVKVNGETTTGRAPYGEADTPAPVDPYGQSKWEAEQALSAVAGLDKVVLRPPLVYGPGVGGNFRQLLKLAKLGLPLPLGAIDNRRSLIFVENLADAVAVALTGPTGTFLLRDGEDISTPQLISRLSPRPVRLPNLQPSWLHLAGRLLGRAAQVERLTGSLQIDDGAFRAAHDWTPPFSLQEGLRRTALGRPTPESNEGIPPYPKPPP